MIPAYFSKANKKALYKQLIENPLAVSFKDLAVGLIFGTVIGGLAYFLSKRRFPAPLIFSVATLCAGTSSAISLIASSTLQSKAPFKEYAERKALRESQAATTRAQALPLEGRSIPKLEKELIIALKARQWATTPGSQQQIDANIAEIRRLTGIIVAGI